jgi:hypothetical protein
MASPASNRRIPEPERRNFPPSHLVTPYFEPCQRSVDARRSAPFRCVRQKINPEDSHV